MLPRLSRSQLGVLRSSPFLTVDSDVSVALAGIQLVTCFVDLISPPRRPASASAPKTSLHAALGHHVPAPYLPSVIYRCHKSTSGPPAICAHSQCAADIRYEQSQTATSGTALIYLGCGADNLAHVSPTSRSLSCNLPARTYTLTTLRGLQPSCGSRTRRGSPRPWPAHPPLAGLDRLRTIEYTSCQPRPRIPAATVGRPRQRIPRRPCLPSRKFSLPQ